jgi:hypothetical protein
MPNGDRMTVTRFRERAFGNRQMISFRWSSGGPSTSMTAVEAENLFNALNYFKHGWGKVPSEKTFIEGGAAQ